MDFSEAATDVLRKKDFLKNFAIFTGKLQACRFIKNTLQHTRFPLNIAKFLRTPISQKICLVKATSVLTLLLSSDNLSTGYEQLSY